MKRSTLCQWALFFTWMIAVVGFLATLYASDVLQLPVCHLCWYQRICIYPLIIIVGMASFRNDGGIALYALPLTLLGAVFALFQYLEQMVPGFSPINVCKGGPSCSTIHLQWFGFITLPFLSIVACVLMTILLIIAHYSKSYS